MFCVLNINNSILVDESSPSIFKHCNKILSDVEQGLYEYETDGLIFTPSLLPVGQNTKGDKIENKRKLGFIV